MERTPNRKFKFSSRKTELRNDNDNFPDDSCYVPSSSSTPMQPKTTSLYEDCSPIYFPSTQDGSDQVEVVWDWNSPQSKPKQKPLKKTRLRVHSPKAPVKKNTHNQPIVNEKVKNQLEKLKNQLESELSGKSKGVANMRNVIDLKDLDDLFNDSIEQELILQSQRVENLINLELKEGACDITTNLNCTETKPGEFRKFKSDEQLNQSTSKSTFRVKSTSSSNLYESPKQKAAASVKLQGKFQSTFDDSFDLALQSFKGNDLKTNNGSRCKSDSSMSMSFVEDISLFDMQEIERKRQEALAKLRAKKLHNVISPSKRPIESSYTIIDVTTKVPKAEESPIKCSPEEIEQKRLQALAKLEAKKKQDIIEKNRKEALKRLELNKKKRAMLLQNMKSN